MSCAIRNIVHHVHLPSTTPYNWALRLQQELAKQASNKVDSNSNFLLTLEHKPVYTVGLRKDKSYSYDLFEKLKTLGADVVQVERGGLITFHGPGQIVAYPIINLKNFPFIPGVRCYVDYLHNAILATCFGFGVKAELHPSYVGVFVGEHGKIASIGVQCRRFVTMHGIALNCNVDLTWFDNIVACGLTDKKATSISSWLNKEVSVSEVLPSFLSGFSGVFKCNLLRDSDYLKNIVAAQSCDENPVKK